MLIHSSFHLISRELFQWIFCCWILFNIATSKEYVLLSIKSGKRERERERWVERGLDELSYRYRLSFDQTAEGPLIGPWESSKIPAIHTTSPAKIERYFHRPNLRNMQKTIQLIQNVNFRYYQMIFLISLSTELQHSVASFVVLKLSLKWLN